STICSKNNYESVRRLLEEHGVWDYFVFPSINWDPKGPRVKELIDTIQLRTESVMLIDDNPLNLNEAIFFVPGIQTSDEKIIPSILGHHLFKGKNDRNLTRLNQYKLLEKRKTDQASYSGGNIEFLRKSNIKVGIIYDIDSNISRIVELINRTN